ncbi:PaaI family thioesterase [Streptomyces monticola]|uniref:PaaI family thioesterase n=1 Tax=Streptomyces monticola TaxID=2666263 RepID=A0ABW2JDV9_9ACTN
MTPPEQGTAPAPGTWLEVPWSQQPDYRCFGCSPHNQQGLRLQFEEYDGGLLTRLVLDRNHESYPGVVHGGLVSTVCDEIMGNLVVLKHGTPAFTVGLRTRFFTPLAVDRAYEAVAKLRTDTGDAHLAHATAEVTGPGGDLVASASASYRCVPMDQARQYLLLGEEEAAALTARLAHRQTPTETTER